MAKKKTSQTQPDQAPNPETKTSYLPTSIMGLQHYSYWWKYVKEQYPKSGKESKPFRRGRIWA